ncbi:hypothetical protein J25TS5_33920 [Paenibacillus faecis]|uniref:DUF4097 domain-containing protein n=1 Tax=Paenibacillus faecis TaxID=862114 RepID=A0A5D0CSL2_9BACL|nr:MULTISPECIES: DUF4097 family beta strand repeat-containing protein [Paenibacillus]MCA1294098.1 DUF4097 domain-containing protein [Paenibacillus sp. alder61]TYA11975.1 DUF4097 domain-containing protein [Paenibacillus faecis]GIO86460.1 hypothetical protein J25TS5_33920 [Paenibacillus faecis]
MRRNTKKWSVVAIALIIAGFAGMAYQGFKFGEEKPHFEQKWVVSDLQSLKVDSNYDMDVEFIESPDGTDYIELSGNMDQGLIDKLKNSSFTGPDVTMSLKEDFKLTFLSINFQSSRQHMTVALADPGMIDRIKFNLLSNSGRFTGLRAKDIELTTTSGNLTATDVTTEHLRLKATSGNLEASDVQGETEIKNGSGNIKVGNLEGKLAAHGTSGNLSFDGVNGSIEVGLTSGDIDINNFTGDGSIKNQSGSVTLTGQRSDSLDISVTSGDVRLSNDPGFQGIYDLKATSGDVHAPDSPMVTKDVIKVRTTSGNISIK